MADLKAQLELTADVSGIESGISKAKKSINGLGFAVQSANSTGAKSIDKFVQSLQLQAATMGKSQREIDLYKLALRGASDAQLLAANTALKAAEAHKETERIAELVRKNMVRLGLAIGAGMIAAAVAVDQLLKKAGDFQDMAEKFGDTAQNFASLAVAAGTAGAQMETIGAASAKLTKNLTGVDDESKDAGAAIKALGLSIEDFKNKSPTDQLETVAKALAGFEDGASKTAVAMALFGKSGAELLPFLKELGAEGGRQVILTEQQIALADEYSDKQARARAEISLHAQALATQLVPTLNEFSQTIADVAKDQEFAATASDILKVALNAGIVIFQTIAVVASDVAFVFKGVGREIGAIAAQLAALAHLDFQGFSAISAAVKEDAERARGELDRFQARIMAIGQAPQQGPRDADADRESRRFADQAARNRLRRPLTFNGATKKDGDKSAEQEAKAQLALDIEQIRKASETVTNVFADSQKIMEAQRAAGLLDEREYYAAKLGFIRLNSEEQQRALQAELARLQQEKLTGKDKLENERKIADVRAKLSKVQQDASAQQIVLDIQEAGAARQRAAALLSARQAAEEYYDEIQRQQQRDLASIGQGRRVRDLNAGLNQIEDRFAGQRRDLDNQRAQLELEGKFTQEARQQYDERLRIINEFQQKSSDSYIAYYASLMEQQGNWAAGANQALQDYFDDSQNVFKGVEGAVTHAFQGMEDALVEFVKTGKLNFRDFASSVISDIARIIIRAKVTGPLANMIMGALGGGGGGAGASFIDAGSTALTVAAKGGIFNSPSLSAYSSQIVSSPTLFAFARGAGLMGEAGPEAIMPLRRGADGKLGVQAAGGGGGITIVNNTSAPIGKVSERRTPEGDRVLVLEEVAAALHDPNSPISRAMGKNYNASRRR